VETRVHLVVEDPSATDHGEDLAAGLFDGRRHVEQLAVEVDDLDRKTAHAALRIAPFGEGPGGVEHFDGETGYRLVTMVAGGPQLQGRSTVLAIGDGGNSGVGCRTAGTRQITEEGSTRRIGGIGGLGRGRFRGDGVGCSGARRVLAVRTTGRGRQHNDTDDPY
jgi:hypothetical protein